MLSCLLNKGAYEYLKSTRDKEVGKILMFIIFMRMYSTLYEGVRYTMTTNVSMQLINFITKVLLILILIYIILCGLC